MAGEGASFIATGEVVGQRPMSQRRDCLDIIDKKSGLAGLLLRPLCGRLLNPTIPEKQGWVKREDLLDWRGRGRKDQMAYAKRFGLSYPTPGGGCLLTNVRTAERFMDLQKHSPDFSLLDFKLLAYGRHFRINPAAKLIIGRNDGENGILIKLTRPDDTTLVMKDVLGPYGLIRGSVSDDEVRMACSIFCKYSRMRDAQTANVTVVRHAAETVLTVAPLTEEECGRFRV